MDAVFADSTTTTGKVFLLYLTIRDGRTVNSDGWAKHPRVKGGPIMRRFFIKVQNAVALRSQDGKDEGATMVEYGLMVALIAVVAVTAVTPLGTAVKNTFTSITSSL